MASNLRPFVGQDISSLSSLPIHQLEHPLVPESLTASPSSTNQFTVVRGSWPSSYHISSLVLSPSLSSLSLSHNQEHSASSSPLTVELVAFSCTCGLHHLHERRNDASSKPLSITSWSEEQPKEAGDNINWKQYDALCPHLISMLSEISKSPESVVCHQAAIAAFETISLEERDAIFRNFFASSQNFTLASFASTLEEAFKQKQLLAGALDQPISQLPLYDHHVIEQEATAAATSIGATWFGTFLSILPSPSSACFSSSISALFKEMIDICIGMKQDQECTASIFRRYALDSAKLVTEVLPKRTSADVAKLASLSTTLAHLVADNIQFISDIFEFKCPPSVDSTRFNAHGWIYLLEMAETVLKTKAGFAEVDAVQYRQYFDFILSYIDRALQNAIVGIRSYSLLDSLPANVLQRFKSVVLPGLVAVCRPFSVGRSLDDGPIFLKPHEFININPFHGADITSIISGTAIDGNSSVQRTLVPENHFTTQERLSLLLQQEDYVGASRLAFAFDAMDILVNIALDACTRNEDNPCFPKLFPAMVEVVYYSSPPSAPRPCYLTYAIPNRSRESLAPSFKRMTGHITSPSASKSMKPWLMIFLLLDYAAMHGSTAIRSLNPALNLLSLSNVTDVLRQLSIFSKSQQNDQPPVGTPSLLTAATQAAVYTAASTPSLSSADVLSQVYALDWDCNVSAHFRSNCIVSMALGFAIRIISSGPSANATHAMKFVASLLLTLCSNPSEFGEYEVIWTALHSVLTLITPLSVNTINHHLDSFSEALCYTPKRFVPSIADAIAAVSRQVKAKPTVTNAAANSCTLSEAEIKRAFGPQAWIDGRKLLHTVGVYTIKKSRNGRQPYVVSAEMDEESYHVSCAVAVVGRGPALEAFHEIKPDLCTCTCPAATTGFFGKFGPRPANCKHQAALLMAFMIDRQRMLDLDSDQSARIATQQDCIDFIQSYLHANVDRNSDAAIEREAQFHHCWSRDCGEDASLSSAGAIWISSVSRSHRISAAKTYKIWLRHFRISSSLNLEAWIYLFASRVANAISLRTQDVYDTWTKSDLMQNDVLMTLDERGERAADIFSMELDLPLHDLMDIWHDQILPQALESMDTKFGCESDDVNLVSEEDDDEEEDQDSEDSQFEASSSESASAIGHILQTIKPKNKLLYDQLLDDPLVIKVFFSSLLRTIAASSSPPFLSVPANAPRLQHALEMVKKQYYKTGSEQEAEDMYRNLVITMIDASKSCIKAAPAIIGVLAGHAVSLKTVLPEACRQWIAYLLSAANMVPSFWKHLYVTSTFASRDGVSAVEKLAACLQSLHQVRDDSETQTFEFDTISAFLAHNIKHSEVLPTLGTFYDRKFLFRALRRDPAVISQMTLSELFFCVFLFCGRHQLTLSLMDSCGRLESDTFDQVASEKIPSFFNFLRKFATTPSWQTAVNQDTAFKASFVRKIIRIARSFPPRYVTEIFLSNSLDDCSRNLEAFFGRSFMYIYLYWWMKSVVENQVYAKRTKIRIKADLQVNVPALTNCICGLNANAMELHPLMDRFVEAVNNLKISGIKTIISNLHMYARSHQSDAGFRVHLGPMDMENSDEPPDSSKRPRLQ